MAAAGRLRRDGVTGTRYASLFSGAGGADLGLVRAGLVPRLMIDADPHACATLRAAFTPETVYEADVHDVLNSGVLEGALDSRFRTVVAGQPPVVRGRVYGNAVIGPDDDAPQLMYRFIDAVAQARPDAFVMFAVPALATRRWDAVLTRLRRTARDLGYDTFAPFLDASDYGVAQRRERVALMGLPAGCKPDMAAAAGKRPRVTAGAALAAVPEGTRDIACPSPVYPSGSPVVVRHNAYSGQLLTGTGRMLDLRRTAPPLPADLGGSKTPVLDLDQLERGDQPWVERYHYWLEHSGGTPGEYDGPPGRMRRLSLHECAALQGFPPGHPFHGPALGQFRQCGTAVPPGLAEAAARALLAGLA